MNKITAGSHSRLVVYESCPYRAKLAYVDRIQEPQRPELPNGQEYPNDRGSRVHDEAENFVRGKTPDLANELRNFEAEFTKLRSLYAANPDNLHMEDMWCFDSVWNPCASDDYNNIWLRIKLDNCVFLSSTEACVIDYKTGKRQYNEIKHAEQTQLYQLAAFIRFPELQTITTELWYLDLNELITMKYKRHQGLKVLRNWNDRLLNMMSEQEYEAKPNTWNCRFCPYKTGLIGKHGPEGTGDCSKNP
jgi:CRISPR/Cas system-associated exonuclease Cas4 (RecB family)